MSKARLLIVHPDPSVLALLSSMLVSLGQDTDEAANDRAAVRLMERGGIDLLVAGVDPADIDGLELLAYMKRKHKEIPVILLFPGAFPEQTKEALRQGASSVLRFPVSATELRAAVVQAIGHRVTIAVPTLPSTNHVAKAEIEEGPRTLDPTLRRMMDDGDGRAWGIVGRDSSLLQVVKASAAMALTNDPLLLVGEIGTGKRLLARAIHQMSPRISHPFVVLDCVAAATQGFRRETHSDSSDASSLDTPLSLWLSKLNEAEGGTLLIDRVGSLPLELEPHLLRLLQQHGDGRDSAPRRPQSSVRIIMTLDEGAGASGDKVNWGQELSQRISTVSLRLPPLRHRGTDIELLAEYFRDQASRETGKSVLAFTRDALDALVKYQWPGNIGELEGVIRRGLELCQGSRITSGHLSTGIGGFLESRSNGSSRSRAAESIRPLKEALEEPEKRIIIQALQALNWNRQETARVLDINRTTLYKKMKKYGLLVDGPIWVN